MAALSRIKTEGVTFEGISTPAERGVSARGAGNQLANVPSALPTLPELFENFIRKSYQP
jgi:hypothetical protein